MRLVEIEKLKSTLADRDLEILGLKQSNVSKDVELGNLKQKIDPLEDDVRKTRLKNKLLANQRDSLKFENAKLKE